MTPTNPDTAPALIAGESHARAALSRGHFEAAVRIVQIANHIAYSHARAIAHSLRATMPPAEPLAALAVSEE
jgi:hypothetical protein